MSIGIIGGIAYCFWRGWLLNNVVNAQAAWGGIALEFIIACTMISLLLLKSHLFPIIVGLHVFLSLITGILI